MKELLQRYCRQGDKAAFNSFYSQQVDRLWRFLVIRGCEQDRAYDLVAEAFLKFIQVVCKDLTSPIALLYRIAINLHIDSYRREQITPVVQDAQVVEQAPDSLAGISDEREYVRALIKKLPENEQNLLLLRYWIGLSHKEIAHEMKIPEGTIRRQCAEAVKNLRQLWERYNHE